MALNQRYALSVAYMSSGSTKALIQQYDPYMKCGLFKKGENLEMVEGFEDGLMKIKRDAPGNAIQDPKPHYTSDDSYTMVAEKTVGRQMTRVISTATPGDTTRNAEIMDGRKVEKYLYNYRTNPNQVVEYLQSAAMRQTSYVYNKYLKMSLMQLFDPVYLKSDADGYGGDGIEVSFDADTTAGAGAPVTSTVDMTSTTTSLADQWAAIVREEATFSATIRSVYSCGPIYRLLTSKLFDEYLLRCEAAKGGNSNARFGESMLDGSIPTSGLDWFTWGNTVYVRCLELPYVTGTTPYTKTLILSKEAIRVYVNSRPMTQAVTFDGRPASEIMQAVQGKVTFTDMVSASFGQSTTLNATFEKLKSSPLQFNMLMGEDGFGGLTSAIATTFSRMPPSTTDVTANNYRMQTAMDFGVLRANNYMIRQISIVDSLVPTTIAYTPDLSGFGASVPKKVKQAVEQQEAQKDSKQGNIKAPAPMAGNPPQSDVVE